jgi:L-serine dehydratase
MISIFDIFKIGIGPSSSHTVGPMRSAKAFVECLEKQGKLFRTERVTVELFGALAHTGRGHGTDYAVLLGLTGLSPDTVDPDEIPRIRENITRQGQIALLDKHPVRFSPKDDLVFNVHERLAFHANAMRFQAQDSRGGDLASSIYYSTGGGFIVSEEDLRNPDRPAPSGAGPYPFKTGDELLEMGRSSGLTIAEMVLANEKADREESVVFEKLGSISRAMDACIQRGCRMDGTLPGALNLRRRAPRIYRDLQDRRREANQDPLSMLDWVSLWAMAANEENAAGGRVVTAPTNGAAGIIPAVLQYYRKTHPDAGEYPVHTFLLTAGAIGILYKLNASISGAEVGCQGEVGVACSMAAAGLTAAIGGRNAQIENAAEIGMEHNLGLTCDPVAGLVQIPCIERNAMAAVKAITASRLALRGDGRHVVSLDKVIQTMQQTGADMQTKYKETSQGGLAVNVVDC